MCISKRQTMSRTNIMLHGFEVFDLAINGVLKGPPFVSILCLPASVKQQWTEGQ